MDSSHGVGCLSEKPKTVLDIMNGLTERLDSLEKSLKDLPCEYNLEWIKQLHNENEGLACVYGDAYVSKLNQHEDKIEDLYALFDELKTKKFKWRRSYVELIEKVMKFLAENPEIIARIGTTIEDVDVALDQIQAGKPDLNNDGKVSNLEKLLYETIGFLMKKEKLWFIITHAVMLLGGCGLGLYLGSIL